MKRDEDFRRRLSIKKSNINQFKRSLSQFQQGQKEKKESIATRTKRMTERRFSLFQNNVADDNKVFGDMHQQFLNRYDDMVDDLQTKKKRNFGSIVKLN